MSWQEGMRKKEQELREYISIIEAQRDEMANALRDIAAGLASSAHPATWTHEVKIRVDAANALRFALQKISRFRP